jgi:triosephosphate isomerase
VVAGNWKMNLTVREASALASAVRGALADFEAADVVLCPPFTALHAVRDALAGGRVALGAQDAHWEPAGAYTGEVSMSMLRDLSCRYVILGHSERRTYFHETDGVVRRKAEAALAAGLTPIVCVGETLAEREAGRTDEVLEGSLGGLGRALSGIVVAYEPVWAIGTGRTATADQAQSAHARIRELLGSIGGTDVAGAIRIQYGGSVKASNAAEIFERPDVDGGLVGGASLVAADFASIVRGTSP